MEIIHERPSQRLHYRVTAPMRVTLDGQTFDAVDWGLGGCRISGYSCNIPENGSDHSLTCTLPFQGFNISLKADARVVRLDEENGQVAFAFTQLGERERSLMQHFVEDLVRGKMTDVADTIVRIDTPVTPVPTKPDPNPVKDMPVRRWPIRQIMMSLFYLTLGLAVFGYVGVYAFASLFRLEVQSAVVSANRVQVTAPISGRVLHAPSVGEQHILAGEQLVVMENVNHENDLRRARTVLASTNAKLAEMETLLSEERRRANGYSLIARNNVRQAESQLDGLVLAKENAELKLVRVKTLANKGLVLAQDVEAAELELKQVVSDLARKEIHIQELKQLIDGGDSIRLFTGNAFAGRLAEMEARVARLKSEQTFQKSVVAELSKKETQQTVTAPFSGRIIDVGFVPGNAVKQGEPMVTVEETGTEFITAFLTQEEVLQVRIGSPANLYFPADDRWVTAEVSEVDRTAGFVDEVSETHRFRAPDSRSAKVILTPVSGQLPTSGTPVNIYFERYRGNVVWRTVEQFLEAK
ncbi:MAG: HlyD family efflux transporter periplasmic adaptor subunit [Roseibium sp.]|uniref:HlyD family efflux transporter periplasmic adaptor subunit n=1 Tax=Roseibium sp. TaxID=1936156 RepID=UPI002610A227|nr:HlyD family efflux transporter periplasmic adaptor subunit [Roseibium sp.]MCV0423876.1 HlyD family efflux transporter periplasmic adaptor subunit [Roseibium sp.]